MDPSDPDRFWRLVANTRERMLAGSPDGYVPVVEVYLNGRPDPLRLATVATYTNVPPWTLLIEHDSAPGFSAGDRAVFVRPEIVLRVEFRLEHSEEAPVGFTVEVRDDEEGE